MLRAISERVGGAKAAPEPAVAPAPASAEGAERRQLTVLFSDLVSSTALSTRLDPEDLRAVIGSYQKCVAETIGRFDGFVCKYMGDGVMAYFGYPRAHEDDAERAARAGLALIEAVERLAVPEPVQVRVGIGTGLVVVGDLIGTGEAQERGVVGETPNLAARLQSAAAPNTVVVDPRTRRLLADLFEYQDLGPIDVKGFAAPVRAYQVVRQSTVESRFEALRATTMPLVGRDEEIDLLMRRWERAKGGDGSVVLLSGEPGIGKSRIVQSVLDQTRNEPHTRLRYFCSPHHQDSALHPCITQLERACGFRREDTPAQRLDKLEAVLAGATNNVNEIAALLADLLSIPPGDRYPPLDLTPQQRKEKTLQALLARVERSAVREPVLLVVEDMHWCDPTTQQLLDQIIDQAPAWRVLVIVTFRPEFAPPWLGRPHVSILNLNRLPPRYGAEMIAHVTGGRALPKEISEQIIDRTDGVPLFIEELTKTVVESGLLEEAGDGYAVTGSLAPLAIPTTLHGSLLARLDRLAPTREVAQIGAALGRHFSHELIGAVADMPEAQLAEALSQLVHAQLIFQHGTPPDAEYTFKHALVQDAAYGTLLLSRRRQLHARIAATLESEFPETAATEPALLARHCAEAGLVSKAAGYRLKAGRQALLREAMIEAEGQLRKGLDLVAQLPDGTDRLERELELQMALGAALIATQGYAAAAVAEVHARARQLCERLDRPSELALVLAGECVGYLHRAELVLACELSSRILDLSEARGDEAIKLQGLLSSAVSWFFRGDFDLTKTHAEQALVIHRRRHAPVSSVDPQIRALTYSFRSLVYLGHLDQAGRLRDETLARARERMQAHTLASVLGIALMGDAHVRAAPLLLLQRAEELDALCAKHVFPYWQAIAVCVRGWCLAQLGDAEQSLALITKALAGFRATGAVTVVPWFLTSLADALGRAGRPAEGLAQIEQAVAQIEQTQERWTEADMHRTRGELLLAVGESAAAEASFEAAIIVARRQNAKIWELPATTALARLKRNRDGRIAARNLLAPVYGWFTEGRDSPILGEAKLLLDELD
jgi:class 3 adenylate cyclase/predicted ATPase